MLNGITVLHVQADNKSIRVLQRLIAVLTIALFVTKADIYQYRDAPLVRPSWAFLVASIALFVLQHDRLATVRRVVSEFKDVLITFLCLVIVALAHVKAALTNSSGIHLAHALLPAYDFYVFTTGIMLGLSIVDIRLWRTAVAASFAIIAVTMLADVVVPGLFSDNPSQAAGLAQNPNGGALTVLVLLVCLLRWDRHNRRPIEDYGLLIFGFTLILFTFSREGILLCLLISLTYIFYLHRGAPIHVPIRQVVLLFLAYWVLLKVLAFPFVAQRIPVLTIPSTKNEAVFSNPMLAMINNDNSISERLRAIRQSVALIEQAPWWGHGSGFSYDRMKIGPHNLYLARWVDNGILGLIALLALMTSLALTSLRLGTWQGGCLTGLFVLFSFVSHNALEERGLLLALSVSLGVAARNAAVNRQAMQRDA